MDIMLTLSKRLSKEHITKEHMSMQNVIMKKCLLHLGRENNMIELFQYYAWYSIFSLIIYLLCRS